jgi:hypothetical protein
VLIAAMSYRYRFRFSIAALLLIVTAISLFLGYARWRRQWMLKEIDALRAEGVQVWGIRDAWIDHIWMRTPYGADIHYAEVSPTQRQLGHTTYEYLKGEGREHYKSLERRCLDLGVKNVDLGPIGTTKERLEKFMESKSEISNKSQ